MHEHRGHDAGGQPHVWHVRRAGWGCFSPLVAPRQGGDDSRLRGRARGDSFDHVDSRWRRRAAVRLNFLACLGGASVAGRAGGPGHRSLRAVEAAQQCLQVGQIAAQQRVWRTWERHVDPAGIHLRSVDRRAQAGAVPPRVP